VHAVRSCLSRPQGARNPGAAGGAALGLSGADEGDDDEPLPSPDESAPFVEMDSEPSEGDGEGDEPDDF
jgi:hypothetical protein